MSIYGSVTLPGTINDISYNANGTYVYAGTSYASGEFQVVNVASLTAPSIAGSVDIAGSSSITGVSYNSTQNLVTAVGNSTTQGVADIGPN
jgi:hypothetical protein